MTRDIDHHSRGAHDASRENGNSYAGSRVRALADRRGRGWRADDESSEPRPGVRPHGGRRYGHDTPGVPQRPAGWLGGGIQMLRNRSLRGIGAATAVGVIVGLIVFTILNNRR